MASTDVQSDSDDGMDEFMDKFKTQRYKNAFTENNWEEVRPAFKKFFYFIHVVAPDVFIRVGVRQSTHVYEISP